MPDDPDNVLASSSSMSVVPAGYQGRWWIDVSRGVAFCRVQIYLTQNGIDLKFLGHNLGNGTELA